MSYIIVAGPMRAENLSFPETACPVGVTSFLHEHLRTSGSLKSAGIPKLKGTNQCGRKRPNVAAEHVPLSCAPSSALLVFVHSGLP